MKSGDKAGQTAKRPEDASAPTSSQGIQNTSERVYFTLSAITVCNRRLHVLTWKRVLVYRPPHPTPSPEPVFPNRGPRGSRGGLGHFFRRLPLTPVIR